MRSKMNYFVIVLVVLLAVLTGCGSMSNMPFNGDITFHDVSMTVPKNFIRDSTRSNEDLWIFEHDNYSQILLMSRDDVEDATPEKMEEMMDFYGTIGGTSTKYEEYAHAYRAEYTKDDMVCQEVMFIYGDNLYTITLRGATAEEFSQLLASVEVGQGVSPENENTEAVDEIINIDAPGGYQFEEGYLKNKPWESPENPYSKAAIYDEATAAALAEAVLAANAGTDGYTIKETAFNPVQMKWTVQFRLSDSDEELCLEIMENCRIVLPEELSWPTVVSGKEAAAEIANTMKKSWSMQNNGSLSTYEVQYIFYEKNEGYWIVGLWPEVDYPSSELLTIAIDEKDCSIVNSWLWELGFSAYDIVK